MSVAVDVEQVVAGYVNTHRDGTRFAINDINQYIISLWNAGCGPIRLNFTQQELRDFLDSCQGICLNRAQHEYVIDKSKLSFVMTPEERNFLNNDPKLIEAQIRNITAEFEAKVKPYKDSLSALRKINQACEKCDGEGRVLRSRACAEDDRPDPNDPSDYNTCPVCHGTGLSHI